MKFVLILTVVCFFTFPGVNTEKCHRRVCRLSVNRIWVLPLRFNPNYCTHAIIGYAQVTDRQEIFVLDRSKQAKETEEFQTILGLKKGNPNVKIYIAVQNQVKVPHNVPKRDFAEFVKMYTTDSLRQNFIRNIINFARARNIDGVKIDVQTTEGGNKEKLTQLFQALEAAFIEESTRTKRPRLLLTAGIPSDKNILDKYYDVVAISKHVEMIDLATYSFLPYDTCLDKPQHTSPLYSQDPSSTRTIDFMSRYVAGKGVSKSKINVGISFGSVKFTGTRCPETRFSGYPNQVCTDFPGFFEAKFYKQDKEVGRYLKWSDGVLYYDDPDTVRIKMKYIASNGYGGVVISDARDDDDGGLCNRGKHPLLKIMYEECRG